MIEMGSLRRFGVGFCVLGISLDEYFKFKGEERERKKAWDDEWSSRQ